MAGITLAQANAKLAEWLAADTAVARNQSYSINNRELTRADADQIRDNIEYWDRVVKRLDRGGIRVTRGVPLG